jgi:hypothetical protein
MIVGNGRDAIEQINANAVFGWMPILLTSTPAPPTPQGMVPGQIAYTVILELKAESSSEPH